MKKLLFFCALSAFLMPICGVRAQIYAEATSSSPTERGIIRENQIAYYEDGGQGYLSNSCCMAAAGDSWLILDLLSPLFPQPGNTNTCIFAYTTDCFREPVIPTEHFNDGYSVIYNRAMRLESGYVGHADRDFYCRPRGIFPAEFEPVKPTE